MGASALVFHREQRQYDSEMEPFRNLFNVYYDYFEKCA